MFRVRINIAGIEARCARLLDATDAEMEAFVARSGEKIAESAKQTHPFQNHTNTLEDSIDAIEPTGRSREGSLLGGAHATAPYASFVNNRPEFEFMKLGYRFVVGQLRSDFASVAPRAGSRTR